MSTIALITGASRREGLGFEVCRQLGALGWTLILTARSLEAAEARAAELRSQGFDVSGHALDVNGPAAVVRLAAAIEAEHGRLDVLINNAATLGAYGEQAATVDLAAVHQVMEGILFGSWRMCQAFLPLLRKSEHPRIVNVSSGAGSYGDSAFGLASKSAMSCSYGIAKAALTAFTVRLAHEDAAAGMLVNAVCPGFTATFEGGEAMGARPVAEGAASIVWAATLPKGGPSGGFFRDGKALPW